MTTHPTDEKLMAYADGELSHQEAVEIEAFLEVNDEARALVEQFQRNAERIKAAYVPTLNSAVPDKLIDAVMSSPTRAKSTVIQMSEFRKSISKNSSMALALAASIALVIGATAGSWMTQLNPTTIQTASIALGPVAKGTPLENLLEKQPSGTELATNDEAKSERLLVIATFRDSKDRICREIEVLDDALGKQPVAAGVACRNAGAATWVVEGAARVKVANAASSTDYVPSGANEADVLQGLLNILGAREALAPNDERSLLDRGWQ
ncbi:MAG: hypothetical protein CTY31_04295 [Hyphomicrobium sp.]|nr:MAG: hypothetical protein CTY39_02935 [Hyphomicrobium sp.]PPD00372.1 MAG: hypothetical protein CTY31_04295 [Hyphomicrobium sp.]